MITRFSIATRLMMIVAAGVVGMLAVGAIDLLNLHRSLMEERQENVRGLIDVGKSLIEHAMKQVENKEISLEEAQKSVLNQLKSIRYGDQEYLFVLNVDGSMIMHPIAENLNGHLVTEALDKAGKRLFREMIDVAQQNGSGFVNYLWPKPGHVTPQPKLSYVRLIAPWGWVIATGIYVDDVEMAFYHNVSMIGVIGLVITALIAAFALSVALGITRPLNVITERMTDVARGRLDVDTPYLDRSDEVGSLARSFQVFKETARADTAKMADVLRRWNHVSANLGGKQSLPQAVCDILTRFGGFDVAWVDIILPNRNSDGALVCKQVGLSAQGWENLELLSMDWSRRRNPDNPMEATLVSGQMFYCLDVLEDSRLNGWRHEPLLSRHRSFVTMPILDGQKKMVAILNLYAVASHAFSPLTLSLLNLVANDLGEHMSQ
ncbi:membrane hypothetical protein [Azospirillaceae bacterium]